MMLPDFDGLEVLRRMRADGSDVPVLFLTAKDAVEDRIAGLTAGGDDYVTKPFSLEEVVARLRGLIRRGAARSRPTPARAGRRRPRPRRGQPRGAPRRHEISLTATEFELLRFLMRNPRRVLSKAQILDRVWNYDFGGQANVVELYISYLRKKIDAGREPMIHTMRGAGYVLKPARERSGRLPRRSPPGWSRSRAAGRGVARGHRHGDLAVVRGLPHRPARRRGRGRSPRLGRRARPGRGDATGPGGPAGRHGRRVLHRRRPARRLALGEAAEGGRREPLASVSTGSRTPRRRPRGRGRIPAWVTTGRAGSTTAGDAVVAGLPMRGHEMLTWPAALVRSSAGPGLALAPLGGHYLVRPPRAAARARRHRAPAVGLALASGPIEMTERAPVRLTDARSEVGQVGRRSRDARRRQGPATSGTERAVVRQFVADASHELRTPLATIRGYAGYPSRARARPQPRAGQVESESAGESACRGPAAPGPLGPPPARRGA